MKIKVISLNIWYGRLLDRVIDFLKSEDADIVLLQEVYDGHNMTPDWLNSWDILKNKLGQYKFNAFSPAFYTLENNQKVIQGNAILSKFPVNEIKTIFYKISFGPLYYEDRNPNSEVDASAQDFSQVPRSLQHATLKISDNILNIFNTQGVWGLDGYDDNEQRLFMSKTIVDSITNKPNVILAGDFNLQPKTKTIANIEDHLKNVFKDELTTTFNMKRKVNPGYATAVVDMLFIGNEFKVLEHNCPEMDISDHFPIIANLEL